MFSIILTILGLTLFEVVNSIDNAVINAEVLTKMSPRGRRWFLVWGILIAVFLVRGLLPWLILLVTTGLGPIESLRSAIHSTPAALAAIQEAKPVLLIGAGVFLILLFVHWLFREEKTFGLLGEEFIQRHGIWFYAVASIFLLLIIWGATSFDDPRMVLAAVIGSTVFFITHGFKENAEAMEERMIRGDESLSDMAKIFYLEAIDAVFSIDGVLGAFAFTLSIPLILIGNGIGAIVVRQLTIGNISLVKRLPFLKNGAMYSILALGLIMVAESFGRHVPIWLSPIITFAIIGYFLWLSIRNLKQNKTA